MSNTTIFEKHDIVVSIKLDSINQQMNLLQAMDVIARRLVIARSQDDNGNFHFRVLKDVKEVKDDEDFLDAEVVPKTAIQRSGTTVVMLLELKSGVFEFYKGRKKLHFDIKDWVYGFDVRLALQDIRQEHLKKGAAIPDTVVEKLEKFSNRMFTIRSLFMDFQSNTFATQNTAYTKTANDSVTESLNTFMSFYFGSLNKDNPFVLGYTVSETDASRYDDDGNIVDELKPVGTVFSVYHDPAYPERSTLNFIIGTKGGHGAPVDQPPNFLENWIGSKHDDLNGRMIFSHGCLVEKLLVRKVYESIEKKIREEAVKLFGALPEVAWDKARSKDSHGINLKMATFDTDRERYTHDVAVSYENQPGNACTRIKLRGAMDMYKVVSTDVGPLETSRAWARNQTSWSLDVDLKVEKENLAVTYTKSDPVSIPSEGRNTGADVLKVISTILKNCNIIVALVNHLLGDPIGKVFEVKAQKLPNFNDIVPNLSTISNSMIILPAGQVFFFKNPMLDEEGNLYCDISYKTEM